MMNYQQQPYMPYGANTIFGQQPMPGMAYPAQVNFTNPLGQQKIQALLKSGAGAPKVQITEENMNQAICTHRDGNQFMLEEIPNGKHKCKICGAEFHLFGADELSHQDVENAQENLWDILQSAKTMWVDSPDQVTRETFQILAVIPKTTALFDIATNRLNKVVGVNPMQQNPSQNSFALLNNITSGASAYPMGMPGMGYMQQPAYPAPQAYPYATQQPMGYQMPAMQPGQMTPMQQQMVQEAPGMQSNGFGYTGSPVQVQPTVMPQQPVAQVAPAPQPQAQAEAPKEGAKVTQTLHV